MLLKVGIAMASLALLMTVAAVAITLAMREGPARAAASEEVERSGEPTVRYGEPQWVPPEKDPPARVMAEAVPQSVPEPRPVQQPKPAPKPPTVAGTDWPAPSESEIRAANGPRHYTLPPGAVMGLTIAAIGIHNAPVFDSAESWALDNGVAHVPETSLPWSNTPQRNVYLEGHRLGYPGTGSHLIFYNLDKLGRGDEVLLKDRGGKRYKYRVTNSLVVEPGESWVMGQMRGRDMVTLQTCTGPGYSLRLIVRADRV